MDGTTRRGLLGIAGVLAATGGLTYGATTLVGDDANADSVDVGGPDRPVYGSEETTSVGFDLSGHPLLGARDAPVDVYYYTDYQCPFCARFEQNTLPDLVRNDVTSGTVRIAFAEYPNIGRASTTAAVLDRCVWRQVRESDPAAWWRWHRTLFDEQGEPNSGWASRENLLDVAERVVGVDASAVASCADDDGAEIRTAIQADVEGAARFGVRATPSFVFTKRGTDRVGKVIGAQPYARFQEAVERIRNA